LVLERLSGSAGRGAGGFLGGLFNNPGVVILGALALALVFFSGDIRKAFGSFGENIGKVELPAINLPDINFPDIKFPDFDFKFPEFDIQFPDFSNLFGDIKFPDLLGGAAEALGGAGEALGETLGGAGEATTDFFGNLQKSFNEFLSSFDGEQDMIDTEPPLTQVIPSDTTLELGATASAIFTPRDELRDLSIPAAPSIAESIIAPFQGGGVSFEGGQIFETPIENLSLSQIIDRFMVTASQASSIRREAQGFPSAETGFVPESFFTQADQGLPEGIEAPDFGGFTGDPQFEGLTPEEISIRLTGGNISNF